MSVFGLYSRYYDLLYRDKDYAAEARFVSDRLRASRAGVQTLLDLGSGTGRHAVAFAELGWEVMGVDLSPGMVAQAHERRRRAEASTQARLDFMEGDVRNVRVGRRFDAVVSLFHVMSYQTSAADLAAALATAAAHLKPGGLFFFDFWFGVAVLADLPTVRVKRWQDEELEVTRIAEPEMQRERNGVAVHYDIFLKERPSGLISEVREVHLMRYLFLPEISAGLEAAGLKLLQTSAWLDSRRPLGPDTWYGCALAQSPV